jgi:hypothetical protein
MANVGSLVVPNAKEVGNWKVIPSVLSPLWAHTRPDIELSQAGSIRWLVTVHHKPPTVAHELSGVVLVLSHWWKRD